VRRSSEYVCPSCGFLGLVVRSSTQYLVEHPGVRQCQLPAQALAALELPVHRRQLVWQPQPDVVSA
jgi:hypothetical protein